MGLCQSNNLHDRALSNVDQSWWKNHLLGQSSGPFLGTASCNLTNTSTYIGLAGWFALSDQVRCQTCVFIRSLHFWITASFYISYILSTLLEPFMPLRTLNFFTAAVPYASDSTAHISLAMFHNFTQNLNLILGSKLWLLSLWQGIQTHTSYFWHSFDINDLGFTLSQATKALRESRGITLF